MTVPHYIYAIADVDGRFVYVGMSRQKDTKGRLWAHRRTWPKCSRVICEIFGPYDKTKEAKWIAYFLAHGEPIVNRVLQGGHAGLPGNPSRTGKPHTEATKKKMSAAQKGRPSPLKGRKLDLSEEERAARSARMKGKPGLTKGKKLNLSDEERARRAASIAKAREARKIHRQPGLPDLLQ